MTSLTPADLERMKRTCEAATEGPWVLGSDFTGILASSLPLSHGGWAKTVCKVCAVAWRNIIQQKADGDFITSARTDLPLCIEEVECLNRELAALRKIMSNVIRLVIVSHVQRAYGRDVLKTGQSCRLCKAGCQLNRPLVHHADCPITAYRALTGEEARQ